uniref:Laminin, beta 3 n=1 Tax=Amphiprion ocellaris TaxID=80972 RepID=A0AAQ5YR15_AMPOC
VVIYWLLCCDFTGLFQDDCSRGACYPPSDDLLLGRAHQLQASSTCGLTGSEVFCTPYHQRTMKCCPCDSRNPNSQLAHTVQEVLSTSRPDRWWQSRKGENPVTLQLDLNNLFQLDNLMLMFKGPRPSALVIERTLDDGRTWQPALYMATDCEQAFPGVPTRTPLFSPLRQYAYVQAPNSQKIEGKVHTQYRVCWLTAVPSTDVSGLTGLRVRLTELGDVPRLPGRALSRFYALKEMRVIGSCMCHGHANRCLPEEYNNPLSTTVQVNPQCDCQHNTAGVNCERCADLYNDLPWRPAEEGNPHTCKRCECNNHAQRCRFDQAVYEASGWRSGGVCEGCLHHTTGPKCDQCAPGYQPNPRSQMDRPDACIRCICSAEGTVNGGRCDDSTGSCQCKVNVEGPRCDRCKRGYYGLSSSNSLGCTKCSCSPDGSVSDVCDPVTGQCPCRPHFHGLSCDMCAKGYWKPSLSERCEPCGCDPTRSKSDTCDQLTGQCQCRPGFGGRTCTECPDNAYGDPLIGCQPCQCDAEGTLPDFCDKQTGVCLCRPGVTGTRCDSCSQNHCDSFPACELCPSCFFTLDIQRQNLSLALERLSPRFPTRPGAGGDLGTLGPRILVLEAGLKQIQDSISLPPKTAGQINDDAYNKSADAADKVNSSRDTVKESANTREETTDIQNQVQPENIRDLDKLNHSMASQPDLTPVAKQVCGSVRSKPCTPLQCEGGDLCPPKGSPPCEKGGKCIGALPLSERANTDAKDVKDRLDKLSGKITEALQKTQDTTNQLRQSTEKLSSKMKQARDELQDDLQEARDVVKALKDFLSDPSSNLTHIQEVSDWVLQAKLPLSEAALKRKLEELKDLAANLPNSTAVLKDAEPQLDVARTLLEEAQDARSALTQETAKNSMDLIDNLDNNLTEVGSTDT